MCFCVEFGECSPAVGLHDLWFFGDVSSGECSDLCVVELSDVGGVGGCGCWGEEVGEGVGEVLFDGGVPEDDAEEFGGGEFFGVGVGVEACAHEAEGLVVLCL